MRIVKPLQGSLLARPFLYRKRRYLALTSMWGFRPGSNEAVVEAELWQAAAKALGQNVCFDTGMPKAQAEFLVGGAFHAPEGKPVTSGGVSVTVAGRRKALSVTGDRFWRPPAGKAGVTGPESFVSMPLAWDRAFGGEGFAANPEGRGMVPIASPSGEDLPLPNIEYADQPVISPASRPQPAGLGRVDLTWAPRNQLAGTYDEAYLRDQIPGLPDDIDWRFFNDAPQDQWFDGFLQGDEPFELQHMHPTQPRINGQLPGVLGRCFIDQRDDDAGLVFREIPLKLDTVWFFPDQQLGVVIFRGSLEVQEPDGEDVVNLMGAYELMGQARTCAHYEEQMRLRTDPENGFKYMLNTQALIPQNCRCGFSQLLGDRPPLEMAKQKNMQTFAKRVMDDAMGKAEAEKERALSQLEAAGIDRADAQAKLDQAMAEAEQETRVFREIAERIAPGALEDPANIDITRIDFTAFDDLRDQAKRLAEEKTAAARERIEAALNEMRRTAQQDPQQQQVVERLETMLADMQRPPPLPRPSFDGLLDNLDRQFDYFDEQIRAVEAAREDASQLIGQREQAHELVEKAQQAEQRIRESYRKGAHLGGEFRSPHEGREGALRESLLARFRQGESCAGGDYAFVDLSGQNLQGIDLSGAYLEYVDFTDCNLSGANLDGAILAHARLTRTRLDKARLTGTNLGACHVEDAHFSDCDMTGATLGRADLIRVRIDGCILRDGLDTFLDTRFEQVDFSRSQLYRALIMNADLHACTFIETDFTQCNFIQVRLAESDFSRATLQGANLVSVDASRCRFPGANMRNVRFIKDCRLMGADFSGANVSEANLRDCQLQDANFQDSQLRSSDLGQSDLTNANFIRADAWRTQFMKSVLHGMEATGANFMEAAFYRAQLQGADLRESNCYGANFMECTLGGTRFEDAILDHTILKDWRPIVE